MRRSRSIAATPGPSLIRPPYPLHAGPHPLGCRAVILSSEPRRLAMSSPPSVPGPGPEPGEETDSSLSLSRRSFVQTLGLTAAATTLTTSASSALARERAAEKARRAAEPEVLGPDPVEVMLNLHGKPLSARPDPATTLLEALRIRHGLTGAKEICDRGACGGGVGG